MTIHGEQARNIPVSTSRMFPFITKTWSPIAGGCSVEEGKIFACPYRCRYCWANSLINKFPKGNLGKKYTGPYRIHEPAMEEHLSPDDVVFVQCMSDIGAPGIPRAAIVDVFEAIRFWEAKGTRFLLLTKNPSFYRAWSNHISGQTYLGATIETDQSISSDISRAPSTIERFIEMMWCKNNLPNRRFICIEPVMQMSPKFEWNLLRINLRTPNIGVAVGYDNYGHKLPEPSLKRTEKLIANLEANNVKVYRKTIREAWDQ